MSEAAGPRAGPGRGQARGGPEAAGLGTGPDRALGRASARGLRPFGRPRPGTRPAHGHGLYGDRRRIGGERGKTGARERERKKGLTLVELWWFGNGGVVGDEVIDPGGVGRGRNGRGRIRRR